ncbi:peptidase inhibitor family I36 [Lentzea atacamensis]|uniref:Peptidase inhibitor family I36 n=1 Tax=Lentzea atacamensis TaxID=531938 RepID=A0ABX9E3U2_9PSEU|nr:peptidase inhibitor family I36 protein [Lentzea atacamensis]RAS61820.1 peptidase inhibitor family I36 [Lentzea atacamensis]
MRKALSVLVAAAFALSSAGTASAEPPVSAQALSCAAGNLCVWPVADGSSNRCTWAENSPDWGSGPVRCSWSSSRRVMAAYNNKTDSRYVGVCLYSGTYYRGDTVHFIPPRQAVTWPAGVIVRSHRWVTSTC